jgi:hypothetical protein
MQSIEEVYGEEVVENIKQKKAERYDQKNSISDEEFAEVCRISVEEGKFAEGTPHFQFTGEDGVTHDVIIAELVDPQDGEPWDYLDEPWEGAANLPLEYLTEWYWSTFPRGEEQVQKLNKEEEFLVVGKVEEVEADRDETEEEDGEDSEFEGDDVWRRISPVRRIIPVSEVPQWVEKAKSDDFIEQTDEGSTTEEPEPVEQDQEKTDEEDGSGSDEGTGEEDSTTGEEDSGSGDSKEQQEETTEQEEGSGSDDGGSVDANELSDLLGGGGGDDDEEDEEEDEDYPVDYEPIAAFVENSIEAQDPEEEPQIVELEEGTNAFEKFSEFAADHVDEDNVEGVKEVLLDVIGEHRPEEENNEEEEEEDSLSTDDVFDP